MALGRPVHIGIGHTIQPPLSSQNSVYDLAYLWAVCESMDPILIAMRLQHHARITRTYESVEHTRNPNIGT